MTTQTTTDACSAILARLSADGRPSHVSHPNLESIVAAMRAAGRTELVHYAGASYRDECAWHLCLAWLINPDLTQSQLLSRAYRSCGMEDLHTSPEDIRAANPGML